jgi:hypothetical protein
LRTLDWLVSTHPCQCRKFLETGGSWIDPTRTTHRFEGFFKAVLTSMHSLI